MRTAFLVLLLGAAAFAQVEAPLGPYARPGVPVVLSAPRETIVDLDGWTFQVEGNTLVHPPRVPCGVRVGGVEVLRLEPVPEGVMLIGVVGDVPGGLGEGDKVRTVAIAPAGLRDWRCLDVFDHVVLTAPVAGDGAAVIATWVMLGGSLITTVDQPWLAGGIAGLGRVSRRLGELPPRRIPLPGNVRPDLYAEVGPVAAAAPALGAARWVALGAALALALQLALGARGRMPPRLLLGGLAAVALLAALIGGLRTRADYTPVARGRIEVAFIGGGVTRLRVYRVYAYAGPGAEVHDAEVPVFFREQFAPWRAAPHAGAVLEEGMVRIYLWETAGAAVGHTIEGGPPPPELWARERPAGGFASAVAGPQRPPVADPHEIPLLRRVEVVLQD